jgi:hypothetical protein
MNDIGDIPGIHPAPREKFTRYPGPFLFMGDPFCLFTRPGNIMEQCCCNENILIRAFCLSNLFTQGNDPECMVYSVSATLGERA